MSTTLASGLAPTTSPPPLWKTYLAILLPMMLTNVLQAAAGTVDGIYLGQLIGVEAIAAVSVFFPIFFVLLAIVIGLSSGATVLIGHAWGAGDRAKARTVAGTAIGLMLFAGLVVGATGTVFAPSLVRALGTPEGIAGEAAAYARWMLAGMPLIFMLWLCTSMSRGVGDAVTPMWTLALATVVSLLLTPVFIRGWGGMPQLGVRSAAASTLLASAAAMAWMLWRWHRMAHPLAPGRDMLVSLRPDPDLVRAILRIGVPTSLQMLSVAVAEIVLLGLVNRHGTSATAAYGAVTQLMSWLQLPAMSLGITASILASHAIGGGRSHRLGAITRTGLWLNVAVSGVFVAAAYLMAPRLLAMFLADPDVRALALTLLHIVAWTVLVRGLSSVLAGVMRATGAVAVPTAITMFAILGIELGAALWLNAALGVAGIWWSYSVAFVAMLAMLVAYYRTAWQRRGARRLA